MSTDAPILPPEWLAAAQSASRNLGLGLELPELPPEHWQRVLVNVETAMRMRGVDCPDGWQRALTHQAGRADPLEVVQDETDARLAERGEVFGRDDDA